MKIPNAPIPSGNGFYNNQESEVIVQYLSDHSDSEDVDNATQDDDFSEYLWMENEEEFDNQVLKQLEEEALMEQCIEAMLEDERDGRPEATTSPSWSTNGSGNAPSAAASAASLADAVNSLHLSGDLVKESTLNPNALEFVPRETPVPHIETKA